MRRVILLCAAVVWLVAGLSPAASAATKTWVGGSGANWSTAANWSPSGAPIAGDLVQFNSPATSNANLGAVAIIGIILGPNSGGTVINGAVTINAATLTINIDDQSTSATASQINATVAITGAALFIKSGNAAHTLSMGSAISGAHAVRIIGPGAVEFASASNNTYTGATAVASAGSNGGAGVLRLSGFATQLVPGDLFIGEGVGAANSAKVQLVATFSQLIKDTAIVTVASDGVLEMGQLSETIARLTGTGSVTSTDANALLIVGDSGDFTWGGVISGPGRINKVGTGSMTYTAAHTYTGLTTVSGGKLVLSVPVIGGPVQAIKGPLSIGLGVGAVTTATVQLANSVQIGSTTVPITINSDGLLDTGVFREDVGPTTINGGKFAIGGEVQQFGGLTMTGGTISGAGTLVLRASNVVATSTLALGASTINLTVALDSATDTITVNSGSTQPELTINGAVTGGLFSFANLIKTGAGTLRLEGSTANTYGGSTTIAQGTLELAKPANVAAISGPIVIGNATDPPGSAVLRNLEARQIGGKPSVTINASGAFNVNSPSLSNQRVESIGSLAGAGSLLMPNFSTLVIDIPSGSASFGGTLSSQLSATSLIQKHGAGEQIFTGNGSAYVASASVFLGRLTVNSPGVLGSRVEIDNGGELGGTGQIGRLTAYGGGRVRPGNGSGGALSVGTTRFEAGSSLVIDVTNTNVGRLNVTDSVTIHPTAVLELHAAPTFSVPENNFATFISNDGADAIQGTFRGLPEGRSAPAGPRNVTISYVGDDGNDATLTVRKTLDIDGDSQYLAETDGLLIRRFIQNLTGPALIANAVAPGARRTTDADILAYLQSLGSALDVNSSEAGAVDATDALLINRWMLGFRGESLVSGTATPPNFGDRSLYIANTELTLSTVMP
ncbi:MAG: autotransporter-associated beta strand repeat-containing protein [Casimicrobium sp.]